MNNNYIIPANAKKSQLIFGFFTPIDLILFGSGCAVTLILLMVIRNANIWKMLIMLAPAVITGFLVMPVMYYHNVLQLITNVFNYFFNPRIYYWRGWCVQDDED